MPDSRARVWFSLFVLAVFCLGGAGGFFVGRHPPPGPFFAAGPPPGGRGGLFESGPPGPRRGGPGRNGGPPPFGRGPGGPPPPAEIVNRLASELVLDAPQRDQVRKILDDRRDRLEAVHREARERFDKE